MPDYDLYIVFDGVSSNANSHLFIQEFIEELTKNWNSRSWNSPAELFYNTHQTILSLGCEGFTTVCALFISYKDQKSYFLSIGDSRIYSYSNRYLIQLTEDDSLLENVLYRYLGSNDLEIEDFVFSEVDYFANFLICTDGFYSNMENNLKSYFKALNLNSPDQVKKSLLALENGKNSDDSTYIIIRHEI